MNYSDVAELRGLKPGVICTADAALRGRSSTHTLARTLRGSRSG